MHGWLCQLTAELMKCSSYLMLCCLGSATAVDGKEISQHDGANMVMMMVLVSCCYQRESNDAVHAFSNTSGNGRKHNQ